MKKISIKERLILYFVLLSVISIAIVSLFSIFEAKKGIRERAFSQLILLRDLRREQIQTFYNSLGQELAALAQTYCIKNAAASLQSDPPDKTLIESFLQNQQLLDLVMDQRNCKSIHLYLNNKKIYQFIQKGNSINVQPDEFFQVPANIDGAFYLPVNDPGYRLIDNSTVGEQQILMMLAPIIGTDNQVEALLVLNLQPEALHRIIYNSVPGTGLGRTGEAYLVGIDGYMRSPSRFIPESVMKIKVNTPGFCEAVSGRDSTGIYNDYRGIKILGAYGLIKTANFSHVILAEIDVKEAMVPLTVIRNDILIVSSIILMVIFIITWFVAHGITRPLIRLKKAANFISAGTYIQKLEIETDDEIGELTLAFNTMSKEISHATRELKEKEESLRHFYNATLDGIVLHDNGKMVLFNSAMTRLTGYDEEELTNFDIKDILRDITELQCDKDTGNDIYETVLVRKDKSHLPVEVQESCVEFKGKNVRASVIRDISARKKMEDELADERNKRIRAVFDAKDSEQQRLSRELHDGLGQQLVAGRLILEGSLYDDGQNLRLKIIETQHIFDQIIGDIRRIAHDLSPSILREFGLKAAMENLCRNIMKARGILIDFSYEPGKEQLDELTSTYLFRIAQESLNNIQLHSNADHVKINMVSGSIGILLEIEDNGIGFDVKKISNKGGTGLYNIRERVNILNGQFNITSQPGTGTKIQVRIPFKKP